MKTVDSSCAPKAAPGFGVGRMVAAVAGLAVAQAAMGVSTVYTWIGPVNGTFSSTANWNPTGVPDALGEAFELAGGTANMTSAASVDWFNLQSGTLNIANAVFLQVDTQAPNGTNETGIGGGGTINLNSTVSSTGLRLFSGVAGDKFIWGNVQPGVTSVINMGAGVNNQITGSLTGLVLVNQAVIQGGGQIGLNTLNVENSSGVPGSPAIIESNIAGATLTLDPASGGLLNDGVIRCSAGVLRLIGGNYTQTANGLVELVGSDVNARLEITGSTLQGGTLRQTANGLNNYVELLTSSTLSAVNLQGAKVRVPNGQTASIIGNVVIDATSQLALNSVNSTAALQVASGETSATLSGAGGIVMSNAVNNVIRATTTGQELINDLGSGIVGSGQLGNNTLVVTNNTLVESNNTTGLTIDPPTAGGFINNGTLRASNGSILTIQNGAVSNNGTITATGASSEVFVSNADILGGTISTNSGASMRLQTNSGLQNLTIASGSLLRVPNVNSLSLVGTIVNNGTISLESIASTTTLTTATGDVIINGTGQIVASDALNNNITGGTVGHRMTFNNTGGYVGSGQIGLNTLVVTNNTTIAAEGASGLRIDPPTTNGFTNNATVQANPGSMLTILAGPFNNTNGVIRAVGNGTVVLSNATIDGGSILGTAAGTISTAGTSTLTGVTIGADANLTIVNGSQINLIGTTVIDGTITLSSVNALTELRTSGGDAIVNGTGQIAMSDVTNNFIRAGVTGQRFTFNNVGGIRGSGQLGFNSLAITNNTTIAGSGNTGLRIDPAEVGGMDNNGLVVAETDSSVTILGGPFDNTDGVIRAQDNATVTLQATSITGGNLQCEGNGSFVATSLPTLSESTIDAGALLRVINAQTMEIMDGITNNGEIILDSGGSFTQLRVNGNQTIAGSGTITLISTNSRVIASVSNQRLVNQGNTIQGTGNIGGDTLGVTNRGDVLANNEGGLLTIDPPAGAAFLNEADGLVHLTLGNLTVNNGGFTNAGGTVIIDAGRKLDRTANDSYTQTSGLTLVNGELEVDSNNFQLQGGTLAGSGGTTNDGWVDSNITNTGGVISPGQTAESGVGLLTIEGTLTQSGNGETRIEIAGPSSAQHDKVVATGAVTLGGRLRVVLLPGYDMMVGDSFDVIVGASRVGEFDTITVENLPFLLQFNVEMLSDRVRLVAAERCLGDYDLDGGITGNDIAAFFADFELGSLNADLDQDGGITGGDIAEFFTRFENGC